MTGRVPEALLVSALAFSLLAGCGEPPPPETPEQAEASRPLTPEARPEAFGPPSYYDPDSAGAAGSLAPLSDRAEAPGEILMLAPSEVGLVVITGPEGVVQISRPLGTVTGPDGTERTLDEAALDAWLQRFSPLRGQPGPAGVTAEEVREEATAEVSFQFVDGSSESVFFHRHEGALAAIGDRDGPVYAVPEGTLGELLPPASRFSR